MIKRELIAEDTSGERERELGHTPSISLINKFSVNRSWLDTFISYNEDARSQTLGLQVFRQGPWLLKIHRDVI